MMLKRITDIIAEYGECDRLTPEDVATMILSAMLDPDSAMELAADNASNGDLDFVVRSYRAMLIAAIAAETV